MFRHPLRLDELQALCGEDVSEAADLAAAAGLVEREGAWVFRAGRRADQARRMERTAEAERQWRRVRRAGGLLARLPYVRGVLVTGGLSKQSAVPGGDVDFMLLVEPGRVWTVKLGLHLLRRALPGRLRESFCTNYLLATDALPLPTRSMFHAVELATAVPLHGPEACTALLDANPWAEGYVPGFGFSRQRAAAAVPIPSPRRIAEGIVPAGLDARAARLMTDFWDRRYAWLAPAERERRFQRTPSAATNHLHDFSGWVNREYADRCKAAGLSP